ncbi:hypothetical protein ACXR6G_19740 [Ancylomarina sp. YFZ004]
MKASVNFKVFIVLPLLLFVDYVLMILIGCSTCLFGFGDDFYCGPYCIFGKLILGLSAIFFLLLLLPDIKRFFQEFKNSTDTKKRKNYTS